MTKFSKIFNTVEIVKTYGQNGKNGKNGKNDLNFF